jgi:hypothetical protein
MDRWSHEKSTLVGRGTLHGFSSLPRLGRYKLVGGTFLDKGACFKGFGTFSVSKPVKTS